MDILLTIKYMNILIKVQTFSYSVIVLPFKFFRISVKQSQHILPIFALSQGTLAQSVQSACFTRKRSLVRVQYVPQLIINF